MALVFKIPGIQAAVLEWWQDFLGSSPARDLVGWQWVTSSRREVRF